VLKVQQDLEEEKNKAIIKDLEEKVENYEVVLKKKDFAIQDLEIMAKEHEGALEKKDFIIQSMEGSLAEVQAENDSLKNELLKKSEKYEQEKEKLEASLKTEVEKNSNLQKSLKDLQEKCLNFGSRCVQRLKDVFHSIGASSEKFSPSAENLPSTLCSIPKIQILKFSQTRSKFKMNFKFHFKMFVCELISTNKV
jgi:chromosome segregation ATPase